MVYKRIEVADVEDVTVVRFRDRKILDESTIQEVGVELFNLVEVDHCQKLLLNFSRVDFMSSAALGRLLTLDRKVKSNQGKLKFSNLKAEILEVFKITKLNKVFSIYNDEADALAAYG